MLQYAGEVLMFDSVVRLLVVTAHKQDYERLAGLVQAARGETVRIDHAAEAEQARNLLLSSEYDLLLMDYTPGQPESRLLLDDLRLGEADLPVIAILDSPPSREERDILKAGVTDFLIRNQIDEALLERSLRYTLERSETRRQLETLQRLDALTGIPNRNECLRLLERAARRSVQDGQCLAVILINLEGFKKFNEDFGHAVGDQLIVGIADRLKECIRRSDALARIGADEFTVILEDASTTADITQVARKLLDAVGQPFLIEDKEVVVRAAMGIAVCPEAGQDASTLLKHADMAMRQAKGGRQSTYRFYTDSLSARLKGEARLEADLRQALTRNEFLLYYQPRLDLRDGRIVGMEALIRWKHPERGMVPPMEFIPFAESSGQIVPIGYWVVRQACQDMMRMREAGLPLLQMAVNLSFEQFRDRHFITTVTDIIQESGIDPGMLEFELTETAVMSNARKADRCMRLLTDLGMSFSLDDFGTGFSSFAHIQRLPIACLKIDRSFIRSVTSNEDDAVIVRAMINLAHSLELSVVAEGAEEKEQVQFLREHACDQVQGFYFSPPVPYDQVCAMIAADRRMLV